MLSFVIGKEIDPKDDRSAAKYKIGLTDIIKDKILLQGVDISRLDQYFNLFVKKGELMHDSSRIRIAQYQNHH